MLQFAKGAQGARGARGGRGARGALGASVKELRFEDKNSGKGTNMKKCKKSDDNNNFSKM